MNLQLFVESYLSIPKRRHFRFHSQYGCTFRLSAVTSVHTTFLPPASEGWGKVIFSLCVSVHTSTGGGGGAGYPIPGLDRGQEGYPITGLGGGYPGYPTARSGWWGYPPGQVWIVTPTARSGWWGVPRISPGQVWMVGVPGVPPLARTGWLVGYLGSPQPGLDGGGYPGYPHPATRIGWGTPYPH